MQRVMDLVRRVAKVDASVVFEGERGTGKERLARLVHGGIELGKDRTLPCGARLLDPAPVPLPRDPPIRVRKNVPDCWLSLELTEGKNRQVRRMTAAVGHPTLRLIRVRIGNFSLGGLATGSWRGLTADERAEILA